MLCSMFPPLSSNCLVGVHFGRYGNADRPYFLRDVQCDGDEENLLNCSLTRYPSFTTALCDSDDAVGIVCTNSSETGECVQLECTKCDDIKISFMFGKIWLRNDGGILLAKAKAEVLHATSLNNVVDNESCSSK